MAAPSRGSLSAPPTSLDECASLGSIRKKNAIGLEEDTYDLCVSLGADSLNALSFLMGHELAHYYKDHGWIGDFGSGFTDLEVGQEMKALRRDLSKLTEIETEADYFGGFFGYVAGYETLNAADRVLDQIYSTYGLDENLKGYPSLSDRKIIADRSREDLKALIPVFDAGNALLLLGNYIEAAGCFDHIAKSFPSREILNNAGVARALQALNLFESGEVAIRLPAGNRLRQSAEYGREVSRGGGQDRASESASRGGTGPATTG